jgi:DNA polymerase I
VVAEARGWHWLHTIYGWRQFTDDTKVTSVRNFPMQATAAEMFRLACCLATERGVRVCGPIHDAMFIEAPAANIDKAVRVAREAMEDASREVLDGYTIPVEVQITCWPDRFRPDEGFEMWERVMQLVRILASVVG